MSPIEIMRRPLEMMAGRSYPDTEQIARDLSSDGPAVTMGEITASRHQAVAEWAHDIRLLRGPRQLVQDVIDAGRELVDEFCVPDDNNPNNEGEELL
jgi:hypothetical protein